MTTKKPEIGNRTIAIVGRPNVGKSALFNRIAGRRVAIVHEQSGVTRDRLVREVTWGGVPFRLIDTGGLGNLDSRSSPDEIEDGIVSQVDAALEDAACVIFVVDITHGEVPLDGEVGRRLHRSGLPVFCAANKADAVDRDGLGGDFDGMGFEVFPISALHNRGVDALVQKALETLPEVGETDEREPLRVAIVGRPNAGKSSYVNRLLRNDRVIVSDVPGTTRDSVEVPFQVGTGPTARHYVLVDTAGMRKKSKIDTAVERFSLMRAERSIQRADVVIHVVDASSGASAQDRKIANLIINAHKGYMLLLTKWDLMEETTQRQYIAELKHAMPFLSHVPIVYASSVTGMNIRKSIAMIDHVADQISSKLGTGVLNRAILDACERHSAPAKKGKRLKIYYSVQVGERPVQINCFCNDPRLVTPAYRQFLVSELRKRFGLEGAPVVIRLRARRPK